MLKKFFSLVVVTGMVAVVMAGMLFQTALAQDKDAAVLTVSSINDLQKKVGNVAGLIDPNYPLVVQMTLGSATAFGVDMTKPISIVAGSKDNELSVTGFIPVASEVLFNTQVANMREAGTIPETIAIEVKDGFAIVTPNKVDDAETATDVTIPSFQTTDLIHFNCFPVAFLPLIEVYSNLNTDDAQIDFDSIKEAVAGVENVDFGMDITNNGDIIAKTTTTATKGSKIAENYLACEKLTNSVLGGFYDAKAPCAGQFLGAFNDYDKLVKGLSEDNDISEKLREVILLAMDVDKMDIAFSLYADGEGIFGVYAMGISNGDKINEELVNAIEAGDIEGEANVGNIGKAIKLHEVKDETITATIGIHAKYLFVAFSDHDVDTTKLLKTTFKTKPLKKAPIAKNGVFHFDASILKPYFKTCDFDFVGRIVSNSVIKGGKDVNTITIDGNLFATAGKIYAQMSKDATEDSDEDEDIFGDEEDDESAFEE